MVTVGIFGFFQGLVAIVNGKDFFVTTPNYFVSFDASQWGWIHLIVGLVALGTGIGIVMQQTWGRILGIFVAGVSMFSNFAFLPYYPFWSVAIIAFNIFVIWAIATQMTEEV